MNDQEQIRRFAVGSPSGPRSRTWRLWVFPRKSDVYIASRRLGNSIKASLYEFDRSRIAPTRECVAGSGAIETSGDDPRLLREWERPLE